MKGQWWETLAPLVTDGWTEWGCRDEGEGGVGLDLAGDGSVWLELKCPRRSGRYVALFYWHGQSARVAADTPGEALAFLRREIEALRAELDRSTRAVEDAASALAKEPPSS